MLEIPLMLIQTRPVNNTIRLRLERICVVVSRKRSVFPLSIHRSSIHIKSYWFFKLDRHCSPRYRHSKIDVKRDGSEQTTTSGESDSNSPSETGVGHKRFGAKPKITPEFARKNIDLPARYFYTYMLSYSVLTKTERTYLQKYFVVWCFPSSE